MAELGGDPGVVRRIVVVGAACLRAPRRVFGPAPSKDRPDADQQLLECKRFDQVVVRAKLETGDAVCDVATGGQHIHRDIHGRRPESSKDGGGVEIGKHHVENRHVERFGEGEPEPGRRVAADDNPPIARR